MRRALLDQLKTHGNAWKNAQESLARANLSRFVDAHPEWKERIDEGVIPSKQRPELDVIAAELLPAMSDAVAADPVTSERFRTLRAVGVLDPVFRGLFEKVGLAEPAPETQAFAAAAGREVDALFGD